MNQVSALDEVIERVRRLDPKAKAELVRTTLDATKRMRWTPNPGPQTEAFHSQADEIFYGGQAGGGKTDILVGLSLTNHQRSLVLRRTNKEATKLVERYVEVLGTRDGWNGQDHVWRIDGKVIDISGCQLEDDKQKFKGTPHDFIGFDEVSDFTESQYQFIIGWNRSADKRQRCRIVAAGNPPTRPEGLWIIRRWAAWLDPQHPNPAQSGELRWYTTGEDGKEIEVDGPGPHMVSGEQVMARSRTFIPAKLSDNPDLAETNYAATLASLPEELRAAYRDGRFDTALRDDAFQTIPTAWVKEAQQRWQTVPPIGVPMCAIGVDIAQGGHDQTVLAIRHDGWYAPLIAVPGHMTPDGKTAAGLVIAKRRNQAQVIVDIGGGWGGDAFAHLRENGIEAISFMGVKPSVQRTQDKQIKFFNLRSQAWWRFREALDPSQVNGSPIMLPHDAEVVADLCAPTFEMTPNGIKVESKEHVCERLGRSTDKGDAIVMAWHAGPTYVTDGKQWIEQRKNGGPTPKIIHSKRFSRRH